MKKMTVSKNAKAYLYFMFAALIITTLPVEVQAKISDLAKNVGSEAPLLTTEAIKIIAFAGFIFLVMGIGGFISRHKTQIPVGVCFGMLIGGICLLGVVQFATEGIDTVFGSTSNSGLDQIIKK